MNSTPRTIEVRKQERETNQALIRRFTKRLRNSGIVKAAKASQFRRKPKSAQLQKRTVLRKLEKQQEYNRLKKLGRL